MLVAAVASDLLCLLNGSSQTSLLARDALRQALECDPSELDSHSGLVTDALRFLAGYGLYLSLSTDRFVSRVLDALAPSTHQPLVGAFQGTGKFYSSRLVSPCARGPPPFLVVGPRSMAAVPPSPCSCVPHCSCPGCFCCACAIPSGLADGVRSFRGPRSGHYRGMASVLLGRAMAFLP